MDFAFMLWSFICPVNWTLGYSRSRLRLKQPPYTTTQLFWRDKIPARKHGAGIVAGGNYCVVVYGARRRSPDELADPLELEARDLLRALVLREHVRDDQRVVAVEVAGLAKRAEELVEVDVAVADPQVLVHAGGVSGRVRDVPQAVRAAVIEGVGREDRAEAIADDRQQRGGAVAEVEGVRGDVHESHAVAVQPSQDPPGLEAVLDEVIGVRVEVDRHSLALRDRQELLHRAVERVLRFLFALGAARELGVDHRRAELGSDLDVAGRVEHGPLDVPRIRTAEALHGLNRGDRHTRVRRAFAERRDHLRVDLRVVEVPAKVGVRRQLQVFVAEPGREVREVEQVNRVVKGRE